VNPAAREDKTSPLYGMPIINVDEAKTCIVLKRSMKPGFAGWKTRCSSRKTPACCSAMPRPACRPWWLNSRVEPVELQPQPRCGIMMKARCWSTSDELAAAVADRLTEAAGTDRSVPFALMLAGGTTPLAAYARLTSHPPVVATGLHVLFSDDRHVPPESPHSNYGQIRPMLNAWSCRPITFYAFMANSRWSKPPRATPWRSGVFWAPGA
jgi:hypothetical protein